MLCSYVLPSLLNYSCAACSCSIHDCTAIFIISALLGILRVHAQAGAALCCAAFRMLRAWSAARDLEGPCCYVALHPACPGSCQVLQGCTPAAKAPARGDPHDTLAHGSCPPWLVAAACHYPLLFSKRAAEELLQPAGGGGDVAGGRLCCGGSLPAGGACLLEAGVAGLSSPAKGGVAGLNSPAVDGGARLPAARARPCAPPLGSGPLSWRQLLIAPGLYITPACCMIIRPGGTPVPSSQCPRV